SRSKAAQMSSRSASNQVLARVLRSSISDMSMRNSLTFHRHCERSEAIHRATKRKNGLLPPSLFELRRTRRRFVPRNDAGTYLALRSEVCTALVATVAVNDYVGDFVVLQVPDAYVECG